MGKGRRRLPGKEAKECVRAVTALAEAAGLAVGVDPGRNHPRLTLTRPDGVHRIVTLAGSPGRNYLQNALGNARQAIRELLSHRPAGGCSRRT